MTVAKDNNGADDGGNYSDERNNQKKKDGETTVKNKCDTMEPNMCRRISYTRVGAKLRPTRVIHNRLNHLDDSVIFHQGVKI